MMTINNRGHMITIIGVYAPNEGTNFQKKEKYENSLREILDKIPDRHEIILAGDLKSRVGKQKSNPIVSPHGEETVNRNGEKLIDVCREHKLQIMNTYFAHKNIHKHTWHKDARNRKSIIDYYIVRQNSNLKIHDVRVKRGAKCSSDHYLVQAKIYVPYRHQPGQNTKENHNVTRLKCLLLKKSILLLHQRFETEGILRLELSNSVHISEDNSSRADARRDGPSDKVGWET
ncbi:hypothetical protein J437_LFUL001235 [Ladona fulva]|uniref:Endonuclease/exonuclease/phosphatase domain-containing protein n=1 Tax=Ladona fulva TaxID=123851 RepID=A0A8K0NVN9_LADFU|nr:hypothetical protein J437_LFUL001235 [Ladona fulva]